MDSRPENRYGTSGAVERRVGNELVIQHELKGFIELKSVVGFQDFFRAVAQRAVAVEYAQAAGRQKCSLIARSAAHDAGKAKDVVLPFWQILQRAFDAHAE